MSDRLFSVADQVVVVSGGSRGIGKSIAAGFAQRSEHVIVTGRNEEVLQKTKEEIQVKPESVSTAICDVSEADQIRNFVDQVIRDHGRIDTLVNVAGVNRRKPALEITDDDYDFVMNINLRGAFQLSREVGKHMVGRESGSQINITSLNNDRPLRNVSPYAMSKAAMGQMTKALALEWGPHGVRVNGLAPGFILTDLTQKLWSNPTMQQWGTSNTPQRRMGVPEDMIGTAIFLASPAAAFMTGQVLYVDGGFTAGWAWPIDDDNA
ncbi:MAG: glucose 1-dehydrogenase [Pirellulaceae bacterium]|nr:glucose 1-dehydrogenase [Pirellulaceae bacterium]